MLLLSTPSSRRTHHFDWNSGASNQNHASSFFSERKHLQKTISFLHFSNQLVFKLNDSKQDRKNLLKLQNFVSRHVWRTALKKELSNRPAFQQWRDFVIAWVSIWKAFNTSSRRLFQPPFCVDEGFQMWMSFMTSKRNKKTSVDSGSLRLIEWKILLKLKREVKRKQRKRKERHLQAKNRFPKATIEFDKVLF